jgi:hypothetical protein
LQGNGNGPAAAGYSPKPANFTDPKFWNDAVKNGYRAMPPVDLKADKIEGVIDYMERTLHQN